MRMLIANEYRIMCEFLIVIFITKLFIPKYGGNGLITLVQQKLTLKCLILH